MLALFKYEKQIITSWPVIKEILKLSQHGLFDIKTLNYILSAIIKWIINGTVIKYKYCWNNKTRLHTCVCVRNYAATWENLQPTPKPSAHSHNLIRTFIVRLQKHDLLCQTPQSKSQTHQPSTNTQKNKHGMALWWLDMTESMATTEYIRGKIRLLSDCAYAPSD